MPEHTVNEDGDPPTYKDKVRPTRDVLAVKPVAGRSRLAERLTQREFGFSVLRSDRGHVPRPALRRQMVCHAMSLPDRPR